MTRDLQTRTTERWNQQAQLGLDRFIGWAIEDTEDAADWSDDEKAEVKQHMIDMINESDTDED